MVFTGGFVFRRTFERTIRALRRSGQRGRPWEPAVHPLRTNLTIREPAVLFGISRSQAHRVVASLTRAVAALLVSTLVPDRRWSRIVDGTLIPTRDHRTAAKAKNYRWSMNAQVVVRRSDLRVVAAFARGPGNRNDPVHFLQWRRRVADTGEFSQVEAIEAYPS